MMIAQHLAYLLDELELRIGMKFMFVFHVAALIWQYMEKSSEKVISGTTFPLINTDRVVRRSNVCS